MPHQSKKMKRSLARERDSKRQSEMREEASTRDSMRLISKEAADKGTRRLKAIEDDSNEWYKNFRQRALERIRQPQQIHSILRSVATPFIPIQKSLKTRNEGGKNKKNKKSASRKTRKINKRK